MYIFLCNICIIFIKLVVSFWEAQSINGMTLKRTRSLASIVSKNGAGYARLHKYCIPTSPINIMVCNSNNHYYQKGKWWLVSIQDCISIVLFIERNVILYSNRNITCGSLPCLIHSLSRTSSRPLSIFSQD